MFLSIITVVKDQPFRFSRTMRSILPVIQKLDCIEWIIVDSSTSSLDSLDLFDQSKFANCLFLRRKPDGVYKAMNFAISRASGKYLLFLNAGDILLQGSINLLLSRCGSESVYIFRPVDTFLFFNFSSSLVDIARTRSFPHQSIVYAKNLHSKYGPYSTELDSDQQFFSNISPSEICYLPSPISNRCLDSRDLTYISWLKKYRLPLIFSRFIHPFYVFVRSFYYRQQVSISLYN